MDTFFIHGMNRVDIVVEDICGDLRQVGLIQPPTNSLHVFQPTRLEK
jgi:hypothetical protein